MVLFAQFFVNNLIYRFINKFCIGNKKLHSLLEVIEWTANY